VLYDAVVLLPSADGVASLARNPAARDFVTDAYAHCKFIGYMGHAAPLLAATGIDKLIDDGFVELGDGRSHAEAFLSQCRQLRYWPRQTAA
jgi:catalase